jgi:hypothetical protein
MLLAIALRSLIPVGFMPSADRPFTLEICPDGFPVQLLLRDATAQSRHTNHLAPGVDYDHGPGSAHHDDPSGVGSHDHATWRSSQCVFAAVASAPPVSDSARPMPAPEAPALLNFDAKPESFTTRRFRIAQPRAPPLLT